MNATQSASGETIHSSLTSRPVLWPWLPLSLSVAKGQVESVTIDILHVHFPQKRVCVVSRVLGEGNRAERGGEALCSQELTPGGEAGSRRKKRVVSNANTARPQSLGACRRGAPSGSPRGRGRWPGAKRNSTDRAARTLGLYCLVVWRIRV